MAADVRRLGGVLPAHFLHCGSHLGGVGGHTVHIYLLATGHHGHPQAGGHCRHLAGACLGLGMPGLGAGQEVPDTGSTAPPPCHPGGGGGLGTLSPLHCLWWLCRWLCPAQRRHVALKSLTLVASRSRSLVTSANRDSQSRLSCWPW